MSRQQRLEQRILAKLGQVLGADEASRRLADLKADAAAEGCDTHPQIGAHGALGILLRDAGVEVDGADDLARAYGFDVPAE